MDSSIQMFQTHPEPEPFTYDTLHQQKTIRLLDLQPGSNRSRIYGALRQIELPDDKDVGIGYTAMSYTWGSPANTFPIYLRNEEDDDRESDGGGGGKLFHIREILFEALMHVRDENEVTTWWIDALCINQGDMYEKNHQVSMMARIYRTAGRVRVWLGRDEGVDGREGMDGGSEVGQRGFGVMREETGNVTDLSGLVLKRLLEREYWSRVWIIQEIMMARGIDLQCGRLVVPWETFARSFQMAGGHKLSSGMAQSLVSERTNRLDHKETLLQQTLETLITRYKGSKCTDSRDKIFALLSLAADCASGNGLQADYTLPRFELLVKTVKFCIPQDAPVFVHTLFEVLQRPERDELWAKARSAWSQDTYPPLTLGGEEGAKESETRTSRVRITHFVAAASSFKDWVRFYSFVAQIDHNFVATTSGPAMRFLMDSRLMDGDPQDVDLSAAELGKSNVAVRLQHNHLVILSANQMTAVASPCTALGLHAGSARCSAVRCEGIGRG